MSRAFQEFLNSSFLTFLGAVNDVFPISCPFFAPGKRFLADWADFAGAIRWLFAAAKGFAFHGL
jgi:hypothetical protein